ncbi:MAG: hypothetical protein H7831_11840, partial [Magnetococcus sp. WYHC-3]
MKRISNTDQAFTEKGVFLDMFRKAVLAVVEGPEPCKGCDYRGVLDDLDRAGIRVLWMRAGGAGKGPRGETLHWVDAREPVLQVAWQCWQSRRPLVPLALPVEPVAFRQTLERLTAALLPNRLVWLDPEGALADAQGSVLGYLSVPRLMRLLEESQDLGRERRERLECIRTLLHGGVGSISICR